MFITIERSRIDAHKLYGSVVAESDFLIAMQRMIDFQFDGFIFIRKRDITARITGTESQRFQSAIMRKEGFWKSPPKFIRKLPLGNWTELLQTLREKPVVVENERTDDAWFGILKGCNKSSATMHCFSPTGVLYETMDRVPTRSITSLQYGDRYTSTLSKYLK